MKIDKLENSDPAHRGEMTITITLTDRNGGAKVSAEIYDFDCDSHE